MGRLDGALATGWIGNIIVAGFAWKMMQCECDECGINDKGEPACDPSVGKGRIAILMILLIAVPLIMTLLAKQGDDDDEEKRPGEKGDNPTAVTA